MKKFMEYGFQSCFFTMFQGLCPGKLVAGCNGAYVGLYGQHLMEEYEILVQVHICMWINKVLLMFKY